MDDPKRYNRYRSANRTFENLLSFIIPARQEVLFDRTEELEREWEMVEEMTENCTTDLEKALVVHDHLVRTIQYSASLGAFVAHDIEGAIFEKKCVCEGYDYA